MPAYSPPRRSDESSSKNPVTTATTNQNTSVLVAGSVAVDLSCDYSGRKGDSSPELHTSNPAAISQSIGGVGHNVALAAHRASSRATVKLCSLVGDDV